MHRVCRSGRRAMCTTYCWVLGCHILLTKYYLLLDTQYLLPVRISCVGHGEGVRALPTPCHGLPTSYHDDDYTLRSVPHLQLGRRLTRRLVDRSDLSSRRHRAALHLRDGGVRLQARGLAGGRWRVGRCAGWRRRLEGARDHIRSVGWYVLRRPSVGVSREPPSSR